MRVTLVQIIHPFPQEIEALASPALEHSSLTWALDLLRNYVREKGGKEDGQGQTREQLKEPTPTSTQPQGLGWRGTWTETIPCSSAT